MQLDLRPVSDPLTVTSGAASLAVEAGGRGPAVVFLHAGVADRRSWRPVAAPLLADHHVVAWDRRGFGDTSVAVPEPYDHVDDLLAVLDALDVERAVLVGNSQGGRTALDATLAQPDRVVGCMMVAAAWTGAPYPDDPPEIEALGEELARAEASDDLDRVNELECRIWLDGALGAPGRVTGPARDLFLDMNGRALTAGDVGEEHRHPDHWPRLGQVAVPITVVNGSLDDPGLNVVAEQATDLVPDARWVLLDDVGHLPPLERPLAVAELVRDLVDRTR